MIVLIDAMRSQKERARERASNRIGTEKESDLFT